MAMNVGPDTGQQEVVGGNASQTALTMPEMVSIVLGFVDSQPALAACASVNSLWRDTAIPLLWQGRRWFRAPDPNCSLPAPDTLVRLAQDEDRFRHFMRHIKYLELGIYDRYGTPKIWPETLFRPTLWKATKLKGLTVPSDSLPAKCWNLKQAGFWHPELQLFRGSRNMFDSNVGHTADFADNLRFLGLDGYTVSSKALLTSLSRMVRLQGLSLRRTQLDSLHSAVLRAILRLPALLALEFTEVEIVEDLISYPEPAFSCLRRLYWTREGVNFSGDLCAELLLRLTSLTEFRLYTADRYRDLDFTCNFLYPLTYCSKLETVDIRILGYQDELKISTAALLGIAAGCPLLKHFAITSEDGPWGSDDPLPSLEPLAQYGTNLEYLAIGFPHDNDDIQMIANGCQKLKELEIFATWYDIIHMRYWDDRLKFPSLEHFTWDFTGPRPDLPSPDEDPSHELVDPQIYAQRIATAIRYCMPNIRSVDVKDLVDDEDLIILGQRFRGGLLKLIPNKQMLNGWIQPENHFDKNAPWAEILTI